MARRRWPFVLGCALLCALIVVLSTRGGSTSQPELRRDSVLMVNAYRQTSNARENNVQMGSAWVYDASAGLVVTSYHVIDGTSGVTVGENADVQHAADVIAGSPCQDVALLRVEDRIALQTIALGRDDEIVVGQKVTVAGYPSASSMDGRVRVDLDSEITGMNGRWTPRKERTLAPISGVLETSPASRGGHSGGPVIDAAGRVVGMTFGSLTPQGGRRPLRSEAIGAGRLRAAIKALRAGRAEGSLGDSVRAQDASAAKMHPGILVRGLAGYSGDFGHDAVLVTAVNGRPVGSTLKSWCAATRGLDSGPVTVTFVDHADSPPKTVRVSINRSHPIATARVIGVPAERDPAPDPGPRRKPSVFELLNGGTPPGERSGWLFDYKKGLVITTAEAVQTVSTLQARTDIAGESQSAWVLAASPCTGTAILQVADPGGMQALRLDRRRLRPNDTITGLGWESSGALPVAFRQVRGKVASIRPHAIETTSIYGEGAIGGPILGGNGRVVAMLADERLRGNQPSLSVAVPAEDILRTVSAFRRGRAPGLLGTGVSFEKRTDQDPHPGIVVNGMKGAYGSFNGGALVTAIDGKPVGDTRADWCRMTAGLPPTRVRVTYISYPGEKPKHVTAVINKARRPE